VIVIQERSSAAVPHSGGKTRRRGEALESALLDAAWDELQAVGYAALTFEAVADRAGTSRAVLYRRWRNRPELVIAAMRRHRPVLSGEIPDTGSLRGDVLALLRRSSVRLAEIGPETVYGLLGDIFADPEPFSRLQDQLLHTGAGVMATILKRAADRGEARSDINVRVAALPTDLFRLELFHARTPPSDQVLTEIVDEVFLPLVRNGRELRVWAGGASPCWPRLADRCWCASCARRDVSAPGVTDPGGLTSGFCLCVDPAGQHGTVRGTAAGDPRSRPVWPDLGQARVRLATPAHSPRTRRFARSRGCPDMQSAA
jgi:AcrR family transcriptional regulator